MELLRNDDYPELQYEASWALTNIASGSSEQTAAVVNAGAVQALLPLMASPDLEVRGQSVWALANISGDGVECRDFVLRLGAMRPLLSLLTAPNPSNRIQRDATWMLSNLCRGKDAPWDIISPCVSVIARLLYSADNDVLADACWALLFITEVDPSRAAKLLSEGIGPQIVSLLKHPSSAVQTPALRVVGNILFGDEDQTQTMVNLNVLSGLEHLMKGDNKKLRKEACWGLSNIAAGNRTQIQAILDHAPLMEILIYNALNAEYAIQLETIYVLCNAINGGTHEQIQKLVGMGIIDVLSQHLDFEDERALSTILQAVDHILDAGLKDMKVPERYYADLFEQHGGLDKLEDLYNHNSNDIYKFSHTVIKKYWPIVDENTTPSINTNGTYGWSS